jgi:hypothetical protein
MKWLALSADSMARWMAWKAAGPSTNGSTVFPASPNRSCLLQ